MNPFNTVVKGKGIGGVITRFGSIGGRYGFSPRKMDKLLEHYAEILNQYGAGGTFPITAVTLSRNKIDLKKYQSRRIEFAIHGFFHTDYSQLPRGTQVSHIRKSIQLFKGLGIICNGFRSPYLRWNEDTLTAVSGGSLLYDSSQGLAWDVDCEIDSPAYQHVLKFYRAESASIYPSTPRLENGIVRLPYALPDDEALVERFQFKTAEQMSEIWLSILHETYRLGELFTLGLHPERIFICEVPLRAILEAALELSPKVWISRMDEIAHWWRLLNGTRVTVEEKDNQEFHFSSDGPDGLVYLSRGAKLITPHQEWYDKYQMVDSKQLIVRSEVKPIIGISKSSTPELTRFLRQQGYIFEIVHDDRAHSIFLHSPNFNREGERDLLSQLENSTQPIVRLGRWPKGARSALCITGDVDALTLWDFGLRIFGK